MKKQGTDVKQEYAQKDLMILLIHRKTLINRTNKGYDLNPKSNNL